MIHFIDLAGDKVIEANPNTGSSAKATGSFPSFTDDIRNHESTKIKVATVTQCLSKHIDCTGHYMDCTETYVVICTCSCHQETESDGG